MCTFRELCDAIQENNEINDAKWSDWIGSKHIQNTYGILSGDYSTVEEHFLNALVRDNGENLQQYLDTLDCLEYGYMFSGVQ